jgi:hypothetical protein
MWGFAGQMRYSSQGKDSGAALVVRGGGVGSPFCKGGEAGPKASPYRPTHPVGSQSVSIIYFRFWLRMRLVVV